VFYIWYNTLPGVPITIWGFFDNAIAYIIGSNPPTIVTHFKPIEEPNASKCSAIYTHNSLVGDNTNPKNGVFYSNKAYITGKAKAKVLPEPVSANAIMSYFFNVYGKLSY